jgi:hypothetical protein
VIQVGDADTLAAMAPVSRVDVPGAGGATGAHIADPSNQWVVLFARTASSKYEPRDTAYSFTAAAPRSRHLLLNMARAATFHVSLSSAGAETRVQVATRSSTGSTPVVSSDEGVLSFEVNGLQVK